MTGSLLGQLSWPEFRHHPWRHLAALVAVMLGVALAFSVQLINQSALSEFSAAVRSVNGQPDFELRGQGDGFDETLYERVARHPKIAIASPVVEAETEALGSNGVRLPLHVVGIDAFVAPALSPDLLPRPGDGVDRLSVIDPTAIFLNAEARRRLGDATELTLRVDARVAALHVAGTIAANGAPTAVMDIAGAQAALGFAGRLSRIDVRLRPGADLAQVVAELALPPGVRAASPDEATERVSNVSRAYRVNLTVLALVALFTGAFLVFSILSLSVVKRQPQFALLGVLGMSARARLGLVLSESALLGVVGSLLGLALGTALASLALRLLAGDLGGGYFPGVAPKLQFSFEAAAIYGLLGVAAAVVGGWLPARHAQRLAPAQSLKGLGPTTSGAVTTWGGPLLIVVGIGLSFAPPVGGIPLAAYVGVACLLLGGIAGVPAGVALLLTAVRPPSNALALLAVERARRQRQTATIAVAGVVASLALAVALTVMVASFRDSVARWLDTILPADLYLRSGSVATSTPLSLPPTFVVAAGRVSGVARLETQRVGSVVLDPKRPAVALIARTLVDPARELPLIGDLVDAPSGATGVYVTEAMGALYGVKPGASFQLPMPDGHVVTVFVRGVWRDYARQHGAVTIAMPDYERLTGDHRVSDLAFWLAPGAQVGRVETALRALATTSGMSVDQLQFASPGEIRAMSLRIFDRSFAVTYWLQSVAIAIGLFGIAASFSAQVLARRKEFGLLAHLGLTRAQVLAIVAAEGAVWTAAGALVGLALGIAVSVVLVEVVNPQSFHWTMDLLLPWGRLGALCAAVMAAGTLTAWFAARTAVSRDMALAVKEDW